MGAGADDVPLAVAVDVEHIHVGARPRDLGGVELPWRAVLFFGLLPPAVGADDVESAVAVDVAGAQAMGKAAGAGDDLAAHAGAADRDALPRLGRILAGDEVAHL